MGVGFTGNAQVSLDFFEVKNNTDLSDDKIEEEFIPQVEATLNNYQKLGPMIDPASGKFSKKLGGKFIALFSPEAEVFPDFENIPSKELINARRYMRAMVMKFTENGFPFQLSNAKLLTVNQDEESEDYIFEVTADKIIQYALDENEAVISSGSKTIPLKILVVRENFSAAKFKIGKIEAIGAKVVEKRKKELPKNIVEKEAPKEIEEPIKKKEPKEKEVERPPVVIKEEKKKEYKEPEVNRDCERLLNTSNTSFAEGVKSADRKQLIESLCQALRNYKDYATLYDKKTRGISERSIERFEKLFARNAKLYNDLNELYAPPTEMAFYVDEVYDFLSEQGVKFEVKPGAVLEKVEHDEAGYYISTINLEKVMYTELDKKKDPVNISGGKLLKLAITYETPTNKLNDSKIILVESREVACPPDKDVTYYGVVGRYGIGLPSSSVSNSVGSFSDLSTTINSIIGGGIYWQSNSFSKEAACKKPLFFRAGVSFNRLLFTSSVSGFKSTLSGEPINIGSAIIGGESLKVFNDGTTVKELNEEGFFDVVGVPLGISYRIKKGFRDQLFVGFEAIPSFTLPSSNRLDKVGIDANLIVELPWEEEPWKVLGVRGTEISDGAYDALVKALIDAGELGDIENSNENRTIQGGLGLSVRIFANYNRDLFYKLGISVGVDYSRNIISPITAVSNIEGDFISNSDSGSILNAFYDNFSLNSAGVRVGVYYKIQD